MPPPSKAVNPHDRSLGSALHTTLCCARITRVMSCCAFEPHKPTGLSTGPAQPSNLSRTRHSECALAHAIRRAPVPNAGAIRSVGAGRGAGAAPRHPDGPRFEGAGRAAWCAHCSLASALREKRVREKRVRARALWARRNGGATRSPSACGVVHRGLGKPKMAVLCERVIPGRPSLRSAEYCACPSRGEPRLHSSGLQGRLRAYARVCAGGLREMFSRIFGKEGAMYLIYVVLFIVRARSHPPCLARPPRGGI